LTRKQTFAAALTALLALAAPACHHGNRQPVPAVKPEFLNITKEQAFQRGEDFFAKKKWTRARSFYQHVYENYPNDPLGRRALLRIADTYFMQGDPVNLVEAQYKYRDFINRYPGSDRADYAMLQIAMVSYKQMERPDRDQAKTREAVEKFDDMLRAYPKSPLHADAEARRQDVVNRLAKHEHLVARYYMKRGSWNAALLRLNGLIDQYGQYNERDAAFYDLATCLEHLGRKGEARLYYERVVSEFPKSEYAPRAKKNLAQS
jgi:outer membrane protein assembly factor BamD